MIDGPSAMDFSAFQGLKEKPRVCISLSERIPGYLNRSQVPPMLSRRSKIPTLFCGHARLKCTAALIPEIPAPTTTTSKCSTDLPAFMLNRADSNTWQAFFFGRNLGKDPKASDRLSTNCWSARQRQVTGGIGAGANRKAVIACWIATKVLSGGGLLPH